MGSSRKMAAAAATANSPSSAVKELFILRHGQATHNPRAEAAREQGCSHEEFLEWMRKDDSLDSELTELGRSQARAVLAQQINNQKLKDRLQLCVSSPLSRALQTADTAVPFVEQRLCVEAFREINGWLLNAKRRPISELKLNFSKWDFGPLVTEEDILWTPELETQADCAERGYQGLCWILDRPEDSIFLVCHGGILRFAMNQHERIKVVDGRASSETEVARDVYGRFGNCELRRYSIAWESSRHNDSTDSTAAAPSKRTIVLTELDQV